MIVFRLAELVPLSRIGESLSDFLDTLEEISSDDIRLGMECDLRKVMNIHSMTSRSSSVTVEDLPLDPVVENAQVVALSEMEQ